MADTIPILATIEMGAPDGKIDDADLERINSYVSTKFKPNDLFVFPAVMATDQLTSYSTHLLPSSLRNFSQDAQVGVPYLLNHDVDGGTYGFTYAGTYDEVSAQAKAAIYIPRGRNPMGEQTAQSTDEHIRDIQQGLKREVSVGFGGPKLQYVCDLCNADLWSEDCYHWPGSKDRKTGQICTVGVANARLNELSGVWRGACPGAIIGKAQKMFAANKCSLSEWREWLDSVQVADPTRTIYTPTSNPAPEPKQGKKTMIDALAKYFASRGKPKVAVKVIGATEDAEKLGAALDAGMDEQLEEDLASNPLLLACAEEKITTPAELKALIVSGRKYANTVRADAKTQCVRLYGEKANDMLPGLDHMPVESLDAMRKTWAVEADVKFGIGKDGEAAKRTSAGPTIPAPEALRVEGNEEDPAVRRKELLSLTAAGRKLLKEESK